MHPLRRLDDLLNRFHCAQWAGECPKCAGWKRAKRQKAAVRAERLTRPR